MKPGPLLNKRGCSKSLERQEWKLEPRLPQAMALRPSGEAEEAGSQGSSPVRLKSGRPLAAQ